MWCWWCCHPFNGKELHLPYEFDDKRDRFTTTGNFCSWNCMKTYAIDNFRTGKGGIVLTNITLMRKRIHGGKNMSTIAAPHRLALKEFGGTMTIDEFRDASKSVDTVPYVRMPYELHRMPDVLPPPKREVKEPTPQDLQAKIEELNSNTDVNEGLLIRRSKPLKRNSNTLESLVRIKA